MFSTDNIKNIDPILLLRLGLGATLLYAGVSIFVNPTNWIGYIPDFLVTWTGISASLWLTIHGVFEITLGLLLVFGLFLEVTSIVAFFDILSIVIFAGIDPVTFRDFGLIFMALALYILVINSESAEQN